MLKMSPFLTFLLYCLFISFTVYYLTKDKLDETSRYMLIGVLILPYVFMDQSETFNNLSEDYANPDIMDIPVSPKLEQSQLTAKLEQPKINLNPNENVENLKALEEVNKRKKIEEDDLKRSKIINEIKNKTYTFDEVKNLMNSVSKNKLIEKYGSMYNGQVKNEYNEDENFTDQSLKPLGENGNGLTNEWDHDYILLNTDKWAPALKPTPVCKTEKTCPVCPNLTTGYPLMLRDFDSTRRVTPPINADIVSMNNTNSIKGSSHSPSSGSGSDIMGNGSNGNNGSNGSNGSSGSSGSMNNGSNGSMNNGSSGSSYNGSMNNGYIDNVSNDSNGSNGSNSSNGLDNIKNRANNNSSFSLVSIINSVPESERPALISELAKQFNIPERDMKIIYDLEQVPSASINKY